MNDGSRSMSRSMSRSDTAVYTAVEQSMLRSDSRQQILLLGFNFEKHLQAVRETSHLSSRASKRPAAGPRAGRIVVRNCCRQGVAHDVLAKVPSSRSGSMELEVGLGLGRRVGWRPVQPPVEDSRAAAGRGGTPAEEPGPHQRAIRPTEPAASIGQQCHCSSCDRLHS